MWSLLLATATIIPLSEPQIPPPYPKELCQEVLIELQEAVQRHIITIPQARYVYHRCRARYS